MFRAARLSLKGITANNVAYVTSDPLYAFIRFFHSNQISPTGVNWGHYKNPDGRIFTLSPWSLDLYWEWTRTIDQDHYAFS